MIIKSFEINKIKPLINNLILFYGQNEGFKEQALKQISSSFQNILKYNEKEILDNSEVFFDSIYSGSLFDEKKFIVINHVTDKALKIVDILIDDQSKLSETPILFIADVLEKKSKLRSIFEKKLLCVPFYPDTDEILFRITQNFFKEKKILTSPSNINFLINKCNGDRKNLNNELFKIEMFTLNKKNLNIDDLQKLVNLSENKTFSELIDNCLAKDIKRTLKILNENIFTDDECIIITRTFLNKLKKILKLIKKYEETKNLEETITNAKPPIFWKDKDIVKKQVIGWELNQIQDLIIDINEIELQIKTNYPNSINLITDFILKTAA